MDREGQMRNVAFGGAWSEQIAGREALARAMTRLEIAVEETAELDLRGEPDLAAALHHIATTHPKGAMLRAAWERALGLASADARRSCWFSLGSALGCVQLRHPVA